MELSGSLSWIYYYKASTIEDPIEKESYLIKALEVNPNFVEAIYELYQIRPDLASITKYQKLYSIKRSQIKPEILKQFHGNYSLNNDTKMLLSIKMSMIEEYITANKITKILSLGYQMMHLDQTDAFYVREILSSYEISLGNIENVKKNFVPLLENDHSSYSYFILSYLNYLEKGDSKKMVKDLQSCLECNPNTLAFVLGILNTNNDNFTNALEKKNFMKGSYEEGCYSYERLLPILSMNGVEDYFEQEEIKSNILEAYKLEELEFTILYICKENKEIEESVLLDLFRKNLTDEYNNLQLDKFKKITKNKLSAYLENLCNRHFLYKNEKNVYSMTELSIELTDTILSELDNIDSIE